MPRQQPVQPRGHERREAILAAARDLYDEVGRDDFRTEDLAVRAGCSIGTIYRYFKNRVDILDQIAPAGADAKIIALRHLATTDLTDEQKWARAERIIRDE